MAWMEDPVVGDHHTLSTARSTTEIAVHRFGAVAHVQLLVDTVYMLPDGVVRHAELVRDLLVEQPFRTADA